MLHTVIFVLFSNQEQASRVQTQLNEEEMKNAKLLQQIAKLEAQISVISQECEHKDEVDLLPSPCSMFVKA